MLEIIAGNGAPKRLMPTTISPEAAQLPTQKRPVFFHSFSSRAIVGKVFSIELSGENKKQLLVPQGFAHGYSVLSETAEVFYKCDDFYNKETEGGLAYNDPALQIDWKIPADKMILSAKDIQHPNLANCHHNFIFQH